MHLLYATDFLIAQVANIYKQHATFQTLFFSAIVKFDTCNVMFGFIYNLYYYFIAADK